MDPRQRIQAALQGELARKRMAQGMRPKQPQQGAPGPSQPAQPSRGLNGMPPQVAAMADGMLRRGLEQNSEQRAKVAEARKLYEKARPFGEATPEKQRLWQQHGTAFMRLLDENPGLERRFVISPQFAAFMRSKMGFQSRRNPMAPSQRYRPAAPTPGVGLLADRPRPDATEARPMAPRRRG